MKKLLVLVLICTIGNVRAFDSIAILDEVKVSRDFMSIVIGIRSLEIADLYCVDIDSELVKEVDDKVGDMSEELGFRVAKDYGLSMTELVNVGSHIQFMLDGVVLSTRIDYTLLRDSGLKFDEYCSVVEHHMNGIVTGTL
jgi:hypothetical protein